MHSNKARPLTDFPAFLTEVKGQIQEEALVYISGLGVMLTFACSLLQARRSSAGRSRTRTPPQAARC